MKKIFFSFVFAFIVTIANHGALAQTTDTPPKKSGSAGSQFLRFNVGARAAGMSGAFGGIAEGVSSLYWNPAGIVTVKGIGTSVEYAQMPGEMKHLFAGIVFAASERINVGVSATSLTTGEIMHTTIQNPEGDAGTYSISDLAFAVTGATRFTDKFSFGATLKYVSNSIIDVSANGFAFDAGTMYRTDFLGMKIGMSVSNLGGERDFSGNSLNIRVIDFSNPGARPFEAALQNNQFAVPLFFRTGIAVDALQGTEGQVLNIAGDFVANSDAPERLHLGTEYEWQKTIALRAGYTFNHDNYNFAAGVGLHYDVSDFTGRLDYAFVNTTNFGGLHRVGIEMDFK